MYQYITFGFFQLPSYSTIIGISFLLVLLVTCVTGSRFGFRIYVILQCFFYGFFMMLIGGKLLYYITSLSWDGMVFYGGLLGGILGICLVAIKYQLPVLALLDYYCPFFAFLHGTGRIGCLLGGCCYGMEYHGIFSITYPENSMTTLISNTPRFPTPILESLGLFILLGFLILMQFQKRKRHFSHGIPCSIYLIFYTMLRFVLEFTRGDDIRGNWGFLTPSQWISLVLFIVGIALLYHCVFSKKNQDTKEYTLKS